MHATLITLAATAQTGRHVLASLLESGWFGQVICLGLLIISVWTWSVIFRKWIQFRKIKAQDQEFAKLFEDRRGDFGAILDKASQYPDSPRAFVFQEVCAELRLTAQITGGDLIMNKETLRLAERRSERAISESIAQVETRLLILAQAAAVCPFVGLLGTIWGLLGAFRSMGMANNASIATVGVGVSEALITTLVGLVAAIPAAWAFNHFRQRTDQLSEQLENFRSEILSRLARNALYHEIEPASKTAPAPAVNRKPGRPVPTQV